MPGPCEHVVTPRGFCPIELVLVIKPTGVSSSAKGDLYAGDQMQVAHLRSRLGSEGERADGGAG